MVFLPRPNNSDFPFLVIARYNDDMNSETSDKTVEQASSATQSSALFFSETENIPTYEFFIFELDGTLYAVSVGDVDQVIKIPPITAVPNSPNFILGIFHLRGRVIVAIDLLKRMNLVRNIPLSPYYLFVAHHDKDYFAILIDKIRTIVRVPRTEVTEIDPLIAAHMPPRYTKGMFMYVEKEPQSKKSKNQEIMFEPASAKENTVKPEIISKPVVWLNVEELLNQTDLLASIQQETAQT